MPLEDIFVIRGSNIEFTTTFTIAYIHIAKKYLKKKNAKIVKINLFIASLLYIVNISNVFERVEKGAHEM